MHRHGLIASLVAGILAHAASAQEADQKALAPLKQFEGSWKKEFKVHKSAWTAKEHSETGVHVAHWVLDRGHLQEIGKDSDNSTYITFYSHDAESREYRMTIFTSAGSVWQFAGRWDPEKKTFTWARAMPDGVRMIAVHQFVRPDEVKFHYIAAKANNEILFHLEGTGLRVEAEKKVEKK